MNGVAATLVNGFLHDDLEIAVGQCLTIDRPKISEQVQKTFLDALRG